ncbi:MAG: TonB-dependent receptor [Cyclobacteriaceae bacterium]|nr:TonB-dependent receptor [Cyclobacteriaceae bacterium]
MKGMHLKGGLVVCICLVVVSATLRAQAPVVYFGDSTRYDAGRRYIVTGTVIQSEDKVPLAGVALYVDGLKFGKNSDQYGRYFIELPPGNYRFVVRYLGKAHIVRQLYIFANGVLNFEMTEKPEALEELVISARRVDENINEVVTGIAKLNITEIRRMPAFLGEVDVLKSLQTLPGVANVGEGSSGFNVRGGRVDQNLVLMDEGQIFNSSHALGLLSNFNPDVVEDFTLYKGNMPAQYGGRSSSVLTVRTRSGDMSKEKVKGGIGLMSSRLAIEGPLIKDKLSYLVGTRFSYSDWLLKTVANTDIRNSRASFYDVNLNVEYRPNTTHTLTGTFYNGYDRFRYSKDFGYRYSTMLGTLKWKVILGEQWSASTSLVVGDYASTLYDLDPSNARALNNGIQYHQFKQNFLFAKGEKHAVNLGGEAVLYRGKPETSRPYGDNSTTVPVTVQKDKGREFAIYANEEWAISSRFSVAAGLRYSLFQYVGPDTVHTYQTGVPKSERTITGSEFHSGSGAIATHHGPEPRLSFRLGLNPNQSLKASYNRLRQYIHLISNGTAPTPVDIWQVSNTFLMPQVADNYSLGYFRNANSNMYETSIEAFYKLTRNVIDYKDFAQLLLNRHIETELLQGNGKSYGIELYAKKNTGTWTGWVSYTWSRAFVQMNGAAVEERINNGDWYAASYDKPHNLSFTTNRKIGKNIRFGLNYTYSTGRPISASIASYQSGSVSVPIYSDRNVYRIPAYTRFDVSLTFNEVFKKIDDSLTISLYNVLGRKNAYSIFYQRTDTGTIPVAYKLSVLGSILPSVTYNFNF